MKPIVHLLRCGAWPVLVALWFFPACADYRVLSESTDGSLDGGLDGGVDAGDDAGDDGGAPDAADQGCEILDPLPVRLQIGEEFCWDCYQHLSGEVLVVYTGVPEDTYSSEVWLWFVDERTVLKIFVALPEDYRVPVEVGQSLLGFVTVDTPWWANQDLAIITEQDLMLLGMASRDFSIEDPEFRCPPQEAECGIKGHPVIDFDPAGRLSQGQSATFGLGPYTSKFFVGVLHQYLTMECVDFPFGWIEFAQLTNALVSQCHCLDHADCVPDEVCEPFVHRCVPNLCDQQLPCLVGEICDPFSGACLEEPERLCRQGDCGDLQACNPATGHCQEDMCQLVDCAPCSPLLGECYQCLHHCDCRPGVCDQEQRACVPGCVDDKLDLTQENPDQCDMYYACVNRVLEDPPDLLDRIDPGVQCNFNAPHNACNPDQEAVCYNDLRYRPNTRVITDDHWHRICELSRNPLVSRIVCGHYLP